MSWSQVNSMRKRAGRQCGAIELLRDCLFLASIYRGRSYMKKNLVISCCVLLGALTPVWAQGTMQAVMKGHPNGDRGKCTIEVNVDDVAEVEVAGDRARIRTLAGQPSQFRRFECN